MYSCDASIETICFLFEKISYYLKKTRKRRTHFGKGHRGDMEEESNKLNHSNNSDDVEDLKEDNYERSVLEGKIDKCKLQLCLLERELLHAT